MIDITERLAEMWGNGYLTELTPELVQTLAINGRTFVVLARFRKDYNPTTLIVTPTRTNLLGVVDVIKQSSTTIMVRQFLTNKMSAYYCPIECPLLYNNEPLTMRELDV